VTCRGGTAALVHPRKTARCSVWQHAGRLARRGLARRRPQIRRNTPQSRLPEL